MCGRYRLSRRAEILAAYDAEYEGVDWDALKSGWRANFGEAGQREEVLFKAEPVFASFKQIKETGNAEHIDFAPKRRSCFPKSAFSTSGFLLFPQFGHCGLEIIRKRPVFFLGLFDEFSFELGRDTKIQCFTSFHIQDVAHCRASGHVATKSLLSQCPNKSISREVVTACEFSKTIL